MKGTSLSGEIGIGKIYILKEIDLKISSKKVKDPSIEINRFQKSIKETIEQIENLKKIALDKFNQDKADIFESHLLLINDPELLNKVENLINEDKVSAQYALLKIRNEFVSLFETIENNEYMQQRSVDIKDVTNRTIAILTNQKYNNILNINKDTIIFSNEITPSLIMQLNPTYIKGIISNKGGKTSHAAIIANSFDMPWIVIDKSLTIKNSDLVILDCGKEDVIINPESNLLNEYIELLSQIKKNKEEEILFKDKQTLTKDNFKTKILANISCIDDLDNVINNGAEGIGLFRTEFLYMKNLPTEEEQFIAYKKVLETSGDKEVVIRTLDIGGDKQLSYLPFEDELNPFLGQRAIRFCLEEKTIFKTQLRALLRASVYGNLKIMFPMISLLEEFIEVKNILKEIENELIQDGIKVNQYQVGIMVEVPSVVILADEFAKEVDFFSIGTNDLIQYTFAADRTNEKLDYLYQPLNPTIIKMITQVINAAHNNNIKVSLCGEAATNKFLIPILIGLKLDAFSMSSTNILKARKFISDLNQKDLSNLITKILNAKTQNEVIDLIKQIN